MSAATCAQCGAPLVLVDGWIVCQEGCCRLRAPQPGQAKELEAWNQVIVPNRDWRNIGKYLRGMR